MEVWLATRQGRREATYADGLEDGGESGEVLNPCVEGRNGGLEEGEGRAQGRDTVSVGAA